MHFVFHLCLLLLNERLRSSVRQRILLHGAIDLRMGSWTYHMGFSLLYWSLVFKLLGVNILIENWYSNPSSSLAFTRMWLLIAPISLLMFLVLSFHLFCDIFENKLLKIWVQLFILIVEINIDIYLSVVDKNRCFLRLFSQSLQGRLTSDCRLLLRLSIHLFLVF